MKKENHGWKQLLQKSGRRVTSQRSLILDLLQRSGGHLDAETLFIRAKSWDPRISLATVYRTLAVLKQEGMVEEQRLGEMHGHFEAVKERPHFHFTCRACGQVIEFQTPLLSRLKGDLEDMERVKVVEICINASGYCSQCRSQRRKGHESNSR